MHVAEISDETQSVFYDFEIIYEFHNIGFDRQFDRFVLRMLYCLVNVFPQVNDDLRIRVGLAIVDCRQCLRLRQYLIDFFNF
jgi:hypothetical protein